MPQRVTNFLGFFIEYRFFVWQIQPVSAFNLPILTRSALWKYEQIVIYNFKQIIKICENLIVSSINLKSISVNFNLCQSFKLWQRCFNYFLTNFLTAKPAFVCKCSI